MTNTREIRSLLYDAPHRLNDLHVEYLLQLTDHLKEDLEDLKKEYDNLLTQHRKDSNIMLGNVLSLLLNAPELLYKEED